MMRSAVLIVICLACSAMAQDVMGPWEILSPVNSPDGVRVMMMNDTTAFCFVQIPDENQIRGFYFFLHDTITSRYMQFPLAEGYTATMEDAISDGGEGWYLSVFEEDGAANRLRIISLADEYLLHEGTWFWPTPWWGEGSSLMNNSRFTPRIGGGAVLTANVYAQWGIEYDVMPVVALMDPGTAEPAMPVDDGIQLYLASFCAAVSTDSDSTALLADQWLSNETWLVPMPQPPEDSVVHTVVECPVHAPVDVQRTNSGNIVALMHETFPDRIWIDEVHPDGSCIEHAPITIDEAAGSLRNAAFHSDYGYVLAFVHPARIMLARLDTLGNEVQPLGIFYGSGEGHAITRADVAIADNGRISVIWSEAGEQSIVQFGTVGWDTYLGVDDDPFTPHPSSFAMSAYPNPFNGTLRIEYELPQQGNAKLLVYDVTGRLVEILRDELQVAGRHTAVWEPRVSSGIYFVQLSGNEQSRVTKVIYLR